MALIYVTGISGSGKSSICKELQKRGFTAYDGDDLAGFYHHKTGERFTERIGAKDRTPEWRATYIWKTQRREIEKLAEESKGKLVFLCGTTANDADELWDLFDQVFALMLDESTLRHRIATRTTNDYGQNEAEFADLLQWQKTAREDYEKLGAVLVDATRPLPQVVDGIVGKAQRHL
jgi:broad-specificity NMP kinase